MAINDGKRERRVPSGNAIDRGAMFHQQLNASQNCLWLLHGQSSKESE